MLGCKHSTLRIMHCTGGVIGKGTLAWRCGGRAIWIHDRHDSCEGNTLRRLHQPHLEARLRVSTKVAPVNRNKIPSTLSA